MSIVPLLAGPFSSVEGCTYLALLVGCLCASFGGYLFAKSKLSQLHKQLALLDAERDLAEIEMRQAAKSRRTSRYELDTVSALLPNQLPDRALKAFLKMILPHPNKGFAAVLKRNETDYSVVASRGEVPGPQLLASLPKKTDARWNAGERFPHMKLVPVGGDYILLCTQIAPSDIDDEQARAVLTRCCDSVLSHARMLETKSAHQVESRATTDMLRLREVADGIGRQADASLTEYLSEVLKHQPFERATLFLAIDGQLGSNMKRVSTAGEVQHAGIEQVLSEQELRLAIRAEEQILFRTDRELRLLGIESLIGNAVTVRLEQEGVVRGVLCLTSAARTSVVDDYTYRLLGWVGDHLVGLLDSLRDRFSMERRAKRDGLTGLLNRAELDQHLKRACAVATPKTPCSLALFDLDKFKNVNDTYGHTAGDAVIRYVAEILESVTERMRLTEQATVARYGGEELGVLLERSDISVAARFAELVRSEIASAEFLFEGLRIPLTISAGVSEGPIHGTTPETLIQAADTGLYASKRLGRNRVTQAGQTQSLSAMKDCVSAR